MQTTYRVIMRRDRIESRGDKAGRRTILISGPMAEIVEHLAGPDRGGRFTKADMLQTFAHYGIAVCMKSQRYSDDPDNVWSRRTVPLLRTADLDAYDRWLNDFFNAMRRLTAMYTGHPDKKPYNMVTTPEMESAITLIMDIVERVNGRGRPTRAQALTGILSAGCSFYCHVCQIMNGGDGTAKTHLGAFADEVESGAYMMAASDVSIEDGEMEYEKRVEARLEKWRKMRARMAAAPSFDYDDNS